MILVHGRGAAPENILDLAGALAHPAFAYLAPGAAGGTWYPYSFMADRSQNEPGLSSGLSVLANLVDHVVASGIPREKIVIGGFSQGACLASEFAARTATRYGGVLVFSGGLIGPPETTWHVNDETTGDGSDALREKTPREQTPQEETLRGDFAGTPVFFGCSDVDAHVPKHRVDESAEVYKKLGASVEKRIYPGMGHLINEDELEYARSIVAAVGGS